jgi:putative spermidine/putrescine transport system permease protein
MNELLTRPAKLLLNSYGLVISLFIGLPIALPVAVAFTKGDTLTFPPQGLSFKWFVAALENPQFQTGMRLSVLVALGSTALATVAGVCAAVAIARYRFKGHVVVQAVLLLPLSVPAIVLGLGLSFVLPTFGLYTGAIATTLGHALLGLPYVLSMVLAALSNHDHTLERASLNLGAGPARTFVSVTLPLIRSGIFAGALAVFLLSFDNISLSLFLSNNDTLPLRMMQQMQSYADPGVAALSTLLLLFSLAALVVIVPAVSRETAAHSR